MIINKIKKVANKSLFATFYCNFLNSLTPLVYVNNINNKSNINI